MRVPRDFSKLLEHLNTSLDEWVDIGGIHAIEFHNAVVVLLAALRRRVPDADWRHFVRIVTEQGEPPKEGE